MVRRHPPRKSTKIAATCSAAEILYPVEKNRLPASAYDKLRQALNAADYVIEEAPLTAGIAEAMKQVPRVAVPDMPDRIVAGTGVDYGVPVISRDGRIRAPAARATIASWSNSHSSSTSPRNAASSPSAN